jgi:outer membrane protein assembly factor BamC
VTTASGVAAQQAGGQARQSQTLVQVPEARIARAGNERWLVVKATPEQAWSTTRTFWNENGFVMTTEQPALGVMETDWAENRAEIPQDALRRTVGKFVDIFYTTYKRDKFRSRIERGTEPGTVEIYVSHRGMEQVPTGKIDNSSPAAFAWALMPPNPDLEAEMLTRLMVKFGTSEPQAVAAVAQSASQPERARVEKNNDGVPQLVVDETFDRAWRRVGLALDRSGLHRRRSRPQQRPVLRALRRSRRRHQQARPGLPREAHVLAQGRGREARAVPDRGRRVVAAQPRDRAGPEGRAGQDAGERPDPRAPQGSTQVMREG